MKEQFKFGTMLSVLGGLTLSLQLYGFKIIQLLELNSTGTSLGNSLEYTTTEIGVSLIFPVIVIIYGIFLIIKSK